MSDSQESLFAKDIVSVATFPECESHDETIHLSFSSLNHFSLQNHFLVCVSVKTQSAELRDLRLSYCSEDLTMKKLLLNLLVLMSQDDSALQVRGSLALTLS